MIHGSYTNMWLQKQRSRKTFVLPTNMDASLGQHSVQSERNLFVKSPIPLANISSFTNSWNHENEPHMMEEHPLQSDLVISRSHGETIFRIQTLT